tara:strand:- start:217 stop:1365 length:1149 start_codon:yes stop_codon:yes gene_type:complete
MQRLRSLRRSQDIWPGFVDAISTLLLVLVFLLALFMLSEVFLMHALSGKDNALDQLNRRVAELTELLNLERLETNSLSQTVAQLSRDLILINEEKDNLSNNIETLKDEKEKINQQLINAEASLSFSEEKMANFSEENNLLNTKINELISAANAARIEMEKQQNQLTEERKISDAAQKQINLLNNQLADLRLRLSKLQAALEASEIEAVEKELKLAELGKRLNAALANKVNELAKYRSEFFGRLNEILGARKGVRIVGDRFIFQSEVLFDSGSAELGIEGREQLIRLSDVFIDISKDIPSDIEWVLQIQGHTDTVPISTARYPSNWELSTARAISVAQIMIEEGILPERISVAGFGEHRPIETNTSPESMRKNRRIEIKLTQP